MSEMDPRLKRIQIFLDGEKLPAAGSAGGMREQLLSAIAANDSTRFKELADEVGQRKISVESDWCQDDVTGRLKTGHLWALQNRPLQGVLFISDFLTQARFFSIS